MSRKCHYYTFFSSFSCKVLKNTLSLHRVFHSIRFKVNKGWDLAKSLFLCLILSQTVCSRSLTGGTATGLTAIRQ